MLAAFDCSRSEPVGFRGEALRCGFRDENGKVVQLPSAYRNVLKRDYVIDTCVVFDLYHLAVDEARMAKTGVAHK